ncbi:MAG: DUF3467 domain-containing protein [Thermovenabulum sp.]|uniref:DUF3467 domain-containing protein n=1 Tax=Thermovenabulum sp. TaxID=3100335 RepID=UPI003C7DE5B2
MEEVKRIPIYYCNVVQVEAGAFDFEFKLGIKKKRNVPLGEDDFDFEVIMSPQHAKMFLKVLSEVVDNYEKNFGVINVDFVGKDNSSNV